MAFTSSVQLYDVTQTDNLRRLVANFRNSLLGVGLVTESIAGTGSLNITAITGSTNTSAIYGTDLFRFNDALQATAPVYIRVAYQTRPAQSPVRFGLSVQVGTQVDASGNLTGTQLSSRRLVTTFNEYSNSGSVPYTNFYSGASNRVCVAFPVDADNQFNVALFSVERTKDVNGNDTNEGILFYSFGVSNIITQCVSISGTVAPEESRATVLLPSNAGTATNNNFANSFVISPVFYFLGAALAPGTNLMFMSTTDSSAGDTIDYNFYSSQPNIKYYGLRSDTFLGLANTTTTIGAHRAFMRID